MTQDTEGTLKVNVTVCGLKKVFLSCSLELKSLIVTGLYMKHLTINYMHFHPSTWQCKRKMQGLNKCQGPLVSRDMSYLSLPCSPKTGVKLALNKCLLNETINSFDRSISLIFQGPNELSWSYSGLLDL